MWTEVEICTNDLINRDCRKRELFIRKEMVIGGKDLESAYRKLFANLKVNNARTTLEKT